MTLSAQDEKAAADATIALAKIQRTNTLVDNLNNIPPFTGELNSTPLTEFLEKLESFALLFQWNVEEKKFALLNRVMGNAAKLIRFHKSKNFKEIVSVLTERYTRAETLDVSLTKFLHFKQTPGMSVQEFFDQATDLSLKALVIDGVEDTIANKSREAMLHSMLLGNLSPEIRKGVISKDPKTSKDILQFALLEEKACRSVNPFYSMAADSTQQCNFSGVPQCSAAATQSQVENSKQSLEIEYLKNQMQLLNAKLDSLVESKAEKSAKTKTNVNEAQPNNFMCFICGQTSHFARFCPFNVPQPMWQDHSDRGNVNNQRGRGNFNNQRGNFNNRGGYNNQNNYRNNRGNYRNNRGNFNNFSNNRSEGNSRDNPGGATSAQGARNEQDPNAAHLNE